jgi:membrane associated rhomboid family serine protease
MPSREPTDVVPGGPIPDGLAEAGTYATASDGWDHGLAVLALGRPYWLVHGGGGYVLLVERQALDEVRTELECFDRESVGWPPLPEGGSDSPRRHEFATPLLWGLAVFAVFLCQSAGGGKWEEAGALDTQAVFSRGEWWRLGTALFLHADFGHLVANEISGIFTFSAVVSTIGRARGWLLVAIASLAGNLAISALYFPGPYVSLGASTAIFAGLGLLVGRAVRVVSGEGGRRRWRPVFLPLATGITLLGLFGAGGKEVDVGAHLSGFCAGVILGYAAALPRTRQSPESR